MLSLILQAVQQARQVVPNVYVTVQQPAGMAEWAKILITVVAGAIVGIGSSSATEVIRPATIRWNKRRMIGKWVNAEFVENMQIVEAADRMLKEIEDRDDEFSNNVLNDLTIMCSTIQRTRFDLYFETEKETVFDLKGSASLVAFYNALGERFRTQLSSPTSAGIGFFIMFALQRGEGYIKNGDIRYVRAPHPIETMLKWAKESVETRRSNQSGPP